ncbi:leucyl aminopeptidase [Ignatzschineria rhizosphaerae]
MNINKMMFQVSQDALDQHATDCLVIGAFEEQLSDDAKSLDKALNGKLTKLLESGDISGKAGEILSLIDLDGIQAKRLVIVGLGKKEKFSLDGLRKAVLAVTRWAKATPVKTLTFSLLQQCKIKETSIATLIQAAGDALYQFAAPKKEAVKALDLQSITVLDANADQTVKNAVAYGQALVNGMSLTKDLANMPANMMTPTDLGEAALALAKEFPNVKATVLDKAQIEALKMGSFLSVAQGSVEEPRFIVLEYKHADNKDEAPIALVGKGVTFDTGGISLKPGAAMDEMKYDMGGAASVLGTFRALAELNIKTNVMGFIPATENMPSGTAVKPGDVVTSMSGQTIEILNTDAEGRLILCDALTYATQHKPKAIVDIATLTGAIIIALGHEVSGLFGNNEALTAKIKASADSTRDHVWEFPIWNEIYQPMLDSNFADMGNISTGGRGAGSITAACFLERFVEEYPWVHLDVAGTAWTSGKEKGSTARPVPLLLDFIKNYQA